MSPRPVSFISPPLLDHAGRPFDSLPCTPDPARWDLDVDHESHDAGLHRRAAARAICLFECTALAECAILRKQLGVLAQGVWAGRTYGRRPTPGETDLIVHVWADQAGVTLPRTRRGNAWHKGAAHVAARMATSIE